MTRSEDTQDARGEHVVPADNRRLAVRGHPNHRRGLQADIDREQQRDQSEHGAVQAVQNREDQQGDGEDDRCDQLDQDAG